MEDRKINEKESLELISRMIQNTRRNLDAGSGNMFLLWGYVCALVTITVAIALHFTKDFVWMWGFFAIPLLGSLLTYVMKRKEKQKVTTYTDRVINQMWQILYLFCMAIVLMSLIVQQMDIILPLAAILFSLGSIFTGIVIRYTAFSGFPSVGAVLGLHMLLIALSGELAISGLWLFALVVVFSMIIPGHILNYKARQESRK